jgi:hypothetical protein
MASGIIFALIGAFLNVVKNPICFILWLAANSIFLLSAWEKSDGWMTLVWLTYLGTSVYGLMTW